MSGKALPDFSLYDLVAQAEPQSLLLPLEAEDFWPLVPLLVDALACDNIPLGLWVKLPPTAPAQALLSQLWQRCNHNFTLICFQSPPELTVTTSRGPAGFSLTLEGAIAPDQTLAQEYFTILLSPVFVTLFVDRAFDVSKSLLNKPSALWCCNTAEIYRCFEMLESNLNLMTDLRVVWQQWLTENCQQHLVSHHELETSIYWSLLTYQHQVIGELRQQLLHDQQQLETQTQMASQYQAVREAMRLKDELIRHLGQELRTPLTNMKTALTLLNSPHLKPPQRQRYMKLLSTECDRQSSLISGLMELIQLDYDTEREPISPLQLSEIVPGVVSTYQPLAQEKGIMLAYTIPDNLPPVLCLSFWLKQIVVHLLHNGIKFTPSGGHVWVKAKALDDYLQIEFRDTGVGIPNQEIPRIFDRFYRGRSASMAESAGAGLGLTIVQQILLRCGGSISVKSKVGEGSTFHVLLPIYHHPA